MRAARLLQHLVASQAPQRAAQDRLDEAHKRAADLLLARGPSRNSWAIVIEHGRRTSLDAEHSAQLPIAINRPATITPAHVLKLAIVYIRQSTLDQVQQHSGSTSAQRGLRH